MLRTFSNVACTICGCVCDDLEVSVDGGRVCHAAPECELADPWWQSQREQQPAYRVAGRAASRGEAAARAAELLRSSRAPLIYGLSRSSTDGQRAAARLADQLGATIDTTASTCHAPSILAVQAVGESTATLGEVRNRSDLVIYWGSNPLESHPRHLQRYVEPPGLLVPEGRQGRHLVVVDVQPTRTSAVADTFIHLEPGGDFEVIWALRALLQDLPLGRRQVAGVPTDQLETLLQRLESCRYGAVFFGLGLTKRGAGHVQVEALLRLVTELNGRTRFIARRMRVPGDVAGADTVLCWQTGFPFSINLARGYPRYSPGEYTAGVLLERGEVDAALLVGSEGIEKLSPAAQDRLREIPTIVLDYPQVRCPIPPAVHFTTAVYGLHRAGTAYRMDEVPIPLQSLIDSPLPADHEILAEIGRIVAG